MKKLLTLLLFTTGVLAAEAQDSEKIYHNEFGIDATGFIKQFLNFNNQEFSTVYTPTYYLTYRRYFKTGNIRFAVGGNFANQDIPSIFTDDHNQYKSNAYSFDARIGWEFKSDLSNRWQVFYGLDFRPSHSYLKNDAQSWNGGYAYGIETKSQIMGFAPLLGFRFRLTPRISLTTEASFSVNFQQDSDRKYFIPITNLYPQMPDVITKTRKAYSSFNQPLSLILTFTI